MYYITSCPKCGDKIHLHIKSYGLKVKGCEHISEFKWKVPAKDRALMTDTPKRISTRTSKDIQTKINDMFGVNQK